MAEQGAHNLWVEGSNPSGSTRKLAVEFIGMGERRLAHLRFNHRKQTKKSIDAKQHELISRTIWIDMEDS